MKTRSKTTKSLFITLLLSATALMIAPTASANHTDCGDPVQDADDYALCRFNDAHDHCETDFGGPCVTLWETVRAIYRGGAGAVVAVLEIAGYGQNYADRLVCDVNCDSIIQMKWAAT